MPKLWKKTGNAKDNSDLVEVDPSQLVIKEPTVVYIPGQITPDDAPEEISRNLNDVKKIFRDLPKPPQIYLWSHPEDTKRTRALASAFCNAVYKLSQHKITLPMTGNDLTSFKRFMAYRLSFQHSSTPAARDLAQNIVMPLVRNAEGQRLSYEEAQQNIRNLTLMGYCSGGFAAQMVYNAARKKMRKAGYSRKEARDLLREIVLVTIGTFSEPKKEENRYTTISFVYNDDSMIGMKNKILHPLGRIFSRSSQSLKIYKLSGSSILVSGSLMGKKRDRRKEIQAEVIENVRLPAWHKGAFNHFFADYVNTNDNTNQFSRMVQHALINAVNRKDMVNPVDLLSAPATLDAQTKALYQYKIQQALRA